MVRPWLKAPRTGATRTLTRIARIHSLTTHLHQHNNNHVVRSASSAITSFGIDFFFKVPQGAEPNRSSRRKHPDSLPANRYRIVRGENHPTTRTGIEPSPSNIGDKLGWPRARAAWDAMTELQTAEDKSQASSVYRVIHEGQ